MALFAMVFLILNGCGKRIVYVESTVAGTESSTGPESLPVSPPEVEESSDGNTEETDASSEEPIYVYVCGAVENPGVYELKAGARVYEAVDAAGGLLENADQIHTNQARVLTDGEQVTILTEEEASSLPIDAEIHTDASENSGGGLVNINSATAEELKTLNGIGEAKAEAIISYREENGAFRSIDEIMNVTGIGESLFLNIKESITVG